MPNYHEFMMRHGESEVQDLIERLERYDGIRRDLSKTLEQRWTALMSEPPYQQQLDFAA